MFDNINIILIRDWNGYLNLSIVIYYKFVMFTRNAVFLCLLFITSFVMDISDDAVFMWHHKNSFS